MQYYTLIYLRVPGAVPEAVPGAVHYDFMCVLYTV